MAVALVEPVGGLSTFAWLLAHRVRFSLLFELFLVLKGPEEVALLEGVKCVEKNCELRNAKTTSADNVQSSGQRKFNNNDD